MCLYAVKAALISLMGDTFKDDKEALAFKHSYDVVWPVFWFVFCSVVNLAIRSSFKMPE